MRKGILTSVLVKGLIVYPYKYGLPINLNNALELSTSLN